MNYGDIYANEIILYGGIPTRRIDIIKDLRGLGLDRVEIDTYLFGLEMGHSLRDRKQLEDLKAMRK